MQSFDVIVIGAGAAGLMCASQAGQGGLSVLLLDHATQVGEKIRISGGGRCNFTNLHLSNQTDPSAYFVSNNPRFVRHALAKYLAQDFIELVKDYDIAFHEKHKGQLFCDHSAKQIIHLLSSECEKGEVCLKLEHTIESISTTTDDPFKFRVRCRTLNQLIEFKSKSLVIATGGLSIPAIGASDFGYQVAKQFGHDIVATDPSLVPLTLANWVREGWDQLAGIALPVAIKVGIGKKAVVFEEDLLFTHKGLTGPAILQISNYWLAGQTIEINLLPHTDLKTVLCRDKVGSKQSLESVLHTWLPKRLVAFYLQQPQFVGLGVQKWADIADKRLVELAMQLNQWRMIPSGTEGYKKAEATRGGVDCAKINPKTMESLLQSDLYFIGEVLDVTGWLGGYNFQWAWSSAIACARALVGDSTA